MSMPTRYAPRQTRAMDKSDIAAFRRNHRAAAIRARDSGFDIVYVYASHGNMPLQFLSPVQNQRVDEYGGSFENRARLIRELLEDTHHAIGDRCAVALRLAVTTLDADIGVTHDGDGRALVEYLAELPDLWDVNVGGYPTDACTARFAQEGAQEDYVDFVKTVTSKPVVTVGRYTSPDRMVARIRNGKADFIGAARPSIADPFLPRKIAEGRLDDIRECIGCNICVMSDDGRGMAARMASRAHRPKTSSGSTLIAGAGRPEGPFDRWGRARRSGGCSCRRRARLWRDTCRSKP